MNSKQLSIGLLPAVLLAVCGQESPGPTLSLSVDPGPSLRLSLTNAGGGRYAIQRSTNLPVWAFAHALVLSDINAGSLNVSNDPPAAFFRATAMPSVTQGRGDTVVASLLSCAGARVAGVGNIAGTDGTRWTVPAVTSFGHAPKASDLYNDCTGFRPAGMGGVDPGSVPVIEVDADGDVITGYLFADNYFELFVNGKLVAVDPVPYTPFNSCIVRFKARAPITYAVRLVDWEENLGLGTEAGQGSPYHAGDGGFIASFSDGTVTDGRWKAQTFYIAPLASPGCVVELPDGTRQSAACSPSPACAGDCFAVHYPVPPNWFAKSFDDSGWPKATTYTEATVGVDNKPAYLNFPAQFGASGAHFIWASNLVLDNEVLVRFTTP